MIVFAVDAEDVEHDERDGDGTVAGEEHPVAGRTYGVATN
jgi:hypothetical protein